MNTFAKNIEMRGNVTSGMDRISDMPRCHVTQSGGQSIANFGALISFSAAFYDTDGLFNPAAPTRITIRTQGQYDVKQNVQFTANATGNSRQAWVQINGGTPRYAYDQAIPNATIGRLTGSDSLQLFAGDYLELFAYQDSGGALVLAPVAATFNGADLKVTLLSTT